MSRHLAAGMLKKEFTQFQKPIRQPAYSPHGIEKKGPRGNYQIIPAPKGGGRRRR